MYFNRRAFLHTIGCPKRIFSTNLRSSGQAKNDTKTLFFPNPPSPVHGNFCNCNSSGICTASRFYVQFPLLYTGWNNAYLEIGPEVRCDLSRRLARKITKSIHSSKPASLNRPIPKIGSCQRIALTLVVVRIKIKIKINRLFHISDATIR